MQTPRIPWCHLAVLLTMVAAAVPAVPVAADSGTAVPAAVPAVADSDTAGSATAVDAVTHANTAVTADTTTSDSAASDTAGYHWYTPDWEERLRALAQTDTTAGADSTAHDTTAGPDATPAQADASVVADTSVSNRARPSTIHLAPPGASDSTTPTTQDPQPKTENPQPTTQNPSPKTLQQCLQIAFVHNFGYRLDLADLDASREQVRRARAPFQFNADASLSLPRYRESRDIVQNEALISRIRLEDTNFDYDAQLQVSQRIPNAGRVSVVGTGIRTDFSSNRRQDFREYSGDLSFRYQQEIFTEPEEDLQLKQAELRLSSTRSDLRRRQLQLETRVTNAYYNLVQDTRQLSILKQRLEQSQAALDLAKRKFEIGLIAEVEALRLQVDKLRAEAEYAQATTRIESRRDELRQVLGVDAGTPVAIRTDVASRVIPVDEATAVAVGLERRTDMKSAQIARRLDEIDLKLTQQRIGPKARVDARINLTGRGPQPGDVTGSLERSLLSASIFVDLPLVDGGQRRGMLRQAEIDLARSRIGLEQVRQQVVVEIREAVRSCKEAERQIRLRNAALEVAERTYEVEQSRFELGLADSQQLLNAQTDLTQARTDALNAVVSYQRALQSLRQATMADPLQLVAPSPQPIAHDPQPTP